MPLPASRSALRAALLCLALLAICPLSSAAQDAAWQPKRFPILLWSNGGDEAYMAILAEAGFTVVMTREEYLPACEKSGLEAIVMPPKGEEITPETAKRLASHPAVMGFMFHDEPKPEEIVQRAGTFHALRAAAPGKLIYVNLAVSPKARAALLKELRPQFLSYDWYQWWFGTPTDERKRQGNLYGTLSVHQKASRQTGGPLWVWVEADANTGRGKGKKGERLGENVVCLRQSVYSNLAGGAKAIQWFNDLIVFNKERTELSACGRDVATINREIRHLADVLLPLTFSQTIHTGPCATAVTPETPVRTGTDNILIGVFQTSRPESSQLVLLVVNKDIHQAAQTRLEFPRPPKSVRRLNKADGSWSNLSNDAGATIPLEPGSGELLEVNW